MFYKGSAISGNGGGSVDAVWGAITGTLSDQTDLVDALAAKQDTINSTHKLSASLVSGLANVATSGLYSDLTGTPTLATVATSGSYADLTNKPTSIASVDNANTAVGATNPLTLWEGTEQEYNQGGESQTWYKYAKNNWGSIAIQGFSGGQYPAALFASDIFVTIYGGGNPSAYYSTDGVNWSTGSISVAANRWIAYGNGTFVAVGNGTVAYSTDGQTWTTPTTTPSGNWRCIAYGNGTFVACGESGAIAYSTDDGASWTLTSAASGLRYNSIVYAQNKFVMIPQSSNYVFTSTDGTAWQSHEQRNSFGQEPCIAYGNGVFVVVDRSGIWYSSDGEIFTGTTPYAPFDTIQEGLKYVIYDGTKFVAIKGGHGGYDPSASASNPDGCAAYSPDGIKWFVLGYMPETGSSSIKYNNLAYGNGKLVSLANTGGAYCDYLQDTYLYSETDDITTSTDLYLQPDNTSASENAYAVESVNDIAYSLQMSVSGGTIPYDYYISSGTESVTSSIGEAHPDWICLIEGVGVKIGTTMIATNTAISGASTSFTTTDNKSVLVNNGIITNVANLNDGASGTDNDGLPPDDNGSDEDDGF